MSVTHRKQEEEEGKGACIIDMTKAGHAYYQLDVYWDQGQGCHLMTSNLHNVDEGILHVDSNDSMGS